MAPVDGATVLGGPPMNRIHHARRRGPKPDRRRALELLAASPDGYTEALMLAHRLSIDMKVVMNSGLTTVQTVLLVSHGDGRSVRGRARFEVAARSI